jgi:hypothetical protein
METLALLRSYSSVVSDLAPDDRSFEKLMDAVLLAGRLRSVGIPAVILGRLTIPQPIDVQAAQMSLPHSAALAALIKRTSGSCSPSARAGVVPFPGTALAALGVGTEEGRHMARTEKVEKVRALTSRFRDSSGAMLADYRGLTVKDVGELRRALRAADASFVVSKNTLTRLAAKDARLEGLVPFLEGPTAVAFMEGDAVAGAKALLDAALG